MFLVLYTRISVGNGISNNEVVKSSREGHRRAAVSRIVGKNTDLIERKMRHDGETSCVFRGRFCLTKLGTRCNFHMQHLNAWDKDIGTGIDFFQK